MNIKEISSNIKIDEIVKKDETSIFANESLKSSNHHANNTTMEIVEPRREVKIMGNKVCLDELLKKLNDARNDAIRLEKACKEKGIVSKRKQKSIQGTGIDIVDMASIRQLAKLGMIEGKPEKVASRVEAIEGLNLLIDGLVKLGMAKRLSDY